MARQPGNRRRALVLTSVAFADVTVRGPEAAVTNKISRCLCQMTNPCEALVIVKRIFYELTAPLETLSTLQSPLTVKIKNAVFFLRIRSIVSIVITFLFIVL